MRRFVLILLLLFSFVFVGSLSISAEAIEGMNLVDNNFENYNFYSTYYGIETRYPSSSGISISDTYLEASNGLMIYIPEFDYKLSWGGIDSKVSVCNSVPVCNEFGVPIGAYLHIPYSSMPNSSIYLYIRIMHNLSLPAAQLVAETLNAQAEIYYYSDYDSFVDQYYQTIYDIGYGDGISDAESSTGLFKPILDVFFGVFGLLDTFVLDDLSLGVIIFFPLIMGMIFFVVSMARGGKR